VFACRWYFDGWWFVLLGIVFAAGQFTLFAVDLTVTDGGVVADVNMNRVD